MAFFKRQGAKIAAAGFLLQAIAIPSAFADEAATKAPAQKGIAGYGFFDNTASRQWKAMIFGGRLSNGELSDILNPTKSPTFSRANFLGAALSNEVYRWNGFSIDFEVGAGYQFAPSRDNNSTAQVWGAAFIRYDAFPWNHIVHTSVAGSVGLNYQSSITDFEINETIKGTPAGDPIRPKKLLHYFSPEIAFSMPDRRDTELVFRLHHRSSASGFFGCKGCGSSVVTVGLRKSF